MSTRLNITFEVLQDPSNYGTITVTHRDAQGRFNDYNIEVSPLPSGFQRMQVPNYIAENNNDDILAADNFVRRFEIDYTLVLTGQNRFQYDMGTRVDNIAQLTVPEGEFTGIAYNGDALNLTWSVETDGIDPPNNFVWRQNPLNVGSCDGAGTIQIQVFLASGETVPYRLIDNSNENVLLENWDGQSTQVLDLERGKNHNIRCVGANDVEVGRIIFRSPAKLLPRYFSYDVRQAITSSDIVISQDVNPENTGPVTYALGNDQGETTPFQIENIFGDVMAPAFGEPSLFYTLYIKDKYGCVIQKTIVVDGFDPTITLEEEDTGPFFQISEYNSLSFKRKVEFDLENRRNYEVTLSYDEAVCIPHQGIFHFPVGTKVQTEFLSSYPYHVATLFRCDGTREALPIELLQQNISVFEKVDAVIFPLDDSYVDENGDPLQGSGVYFNGGDLYEPGTEDVIGDSPYLRVIPSWVRENILITIEGLGSRVIIRTGEYDPIRKTEFFIVDGLTATEFDIRVEVRFNRHIYNVYKTEFNMFDGHGFLLIEPGFGIDQIVDGQQHVSETFCVLKEDNLYLRINWTPNRNIGNLVMYPGFVGEMWVKGFLRPISLDSQADTLRTDMGRLSRNQNEELGMRLDAYAMTPKIWRKLALVSAIGNKGDLVIEGLSLVRVAAFELEELGEVGDTNTSNASVQFAYNEDLIDTSNETVLVTSEGGEESEEIEITSWKGYIRLSGADGELLTDQNGNFFVIGRA